MLIQPANDLRIGVSLSVLLEDSDCPLENLRARLSLPGDCDSSLAGDAKGAVLTLLWRLSYKEASSPARSSARRIAS